MELDWFLVCGLGSLGQHCVAALKKFGVKIAAIEQVEPDSWEVPNLPDLLDELTVGDCRQNSVLEAARIQQCRAALLATTSEQVNAETALAIRQLNPHTRLVVRSAKKNLNQLLSQRLGNFIAYEPTELPASAFALAALGTETLGLFNLEGQWLRILQIEIDRRHPWSNARRLHELNTRTRRLLAHGRYGVPLPQGFHQWDPEEAVFPGDTLVYLESADPLSLRSIPRQVSPSRKSRQPSGLAGIPRQLDHLRERLSQFWQASFQQQVRRIALACAAIVTILLAVGTVLLHGYYPGLTLRSAFFATAILLLGGYGDLFGNIGEAVPIPEWLQLFSLGTTVMGTIFVGILYALLTESLLSSQFQFVRRRPPLPQQNHVIIIGLGRVGERVATLLQQFKQTLVGVTLKSDFNRTLLPDIPLLVGNVSEVLAAVNLSTAKSAAIVTDDEILNLEVALMARAANPKIHLVIRTSGQRLSQHLMALIPDAQVLGTHEVAAEVFAGAAFGENIVHLFRFNHQTVLVTEYQIELGDTLKGLLLAEVAYGYGVVPIFHQRPPNPSSLMPSDDILLAAGDRLVVLATIEGLQRIEAGRRHRPSWELNVEGAMSGEAIFEGANTISRISGCSLQAARELMGSLPGVLRLPLYKPQGQGLVRALRKLQVKASLRELGSQL